MGRSVVREQAPVGMLLLQRPHHPCSDAARCRGRMNWISRRSEPLMRSLVQQDVRRRSASPSSRRRRQTCVSRWVSRFSSVDNRAFVLAQGSYSFGVNTPSR